jgi:hypothetical protein
MNVHTLPAATTDSDEQEDRVRDLRTFRTWLKRFPHMADDLGLLAVAEGLGAAAVAAGLTPAQLIEEIEQGYQQASEKAARRTRQ